MPYLLNEPAKTLFAFLERIRPLSQELRDDLLSSITYVSVKKGAILLEPGQVCENLYFVCQGLLRSYSLLDRDDEVGLIESTYGFMKEGDICISVGSYCSQEPGDEYIEAL